MLEKTKSELIAEIEALRHRLKALEKSGQRFRKTFDASPLGVFVHHDYRILYLNQAFAELFGYESPVEMLALGDGLRIYPLAEFKRLSGYYKARMSGKNFPQRYEYEGLRKDGSSIWLENFVQVVDWEGKEATLATVVDITERKKAEQELTASQTKLAEILHGAEDAIISVDESQQITLFNRGAEKIFGFTANEVIGQPLDLLLPEAIHQAHRKHFAGFAKSSVTSQTMNERGEILGQRKNGDHFPAEASISKFELDGARVFTVIMRDITERKMAEEALQNSQDLLREVFNAIPHHVFFKDLKGRYQIVNRSFGDYWGIDPDHPENWSTEDLSIGDKQLTEFFRSGDRKVLQTGQKVDQFFTFRKKNGGETYRRQIKVPFRNKSGEIVGIIGMSEDFTERKRAEEELKESEFKYRDLVETSQDLIWRSDEQGNFTYVNPAWETTLGYAPDEMLGRPYTDFKTPEEVARKAGFFKLFLAGEKTGHVTTYLSKTGEEHTLSFKVKPIIDDVGNAVGIQGTAQDITERKKTEKKLRDNERLLQTVFDAIPQSVFVRDTKGNFLIVNKTLAARNGLEPENFLDNDIWEIAPELKKNRKEYLEHDQIIFQTRETLKADVASLNLPDGSKRFQQATKTPLLNEAGDVVGVVGISEDMTERFRAEEELRLHGEIVKQMMGGVLLIRAEDSAIIYATPNFEKMFGYGPGELLQKKAAVLNAPGVLTPEEKAEEIINNIESKGWWQGEIHNVKKDGSRFWTTAYLSTFEHSQFGKVWLGVSHDITEKKQIEEQLRQSQKMEAIGTLAGGIAHDFNNLLTPIFGYSELIMKNAKNSSEEFSYANMIFQSAHRAKDLVSQINLFSRRGQPAKSVCDMAPVTKEVIKLVRSTLPKSIAIKENVSGELAFVFCDPSQIHQVILNLCVNAGHAIADIGEIKIALETVALEGLECIVGKLLSGKYVRIAVTDNGVGMDDKTLPQIFDPFFTTKEVGKGTGLGLSTVFGIVQNHGGGITVASEPGKGTTFEVFLPLAEGIADIRPNIPHSVQDTGNENILFVDDEKAIAELGRISLEQFGYNVTAVSDGQQALEIFAGNPGRFNLVVTDQTMPNMTGVTLAHELKKLRPDIPIILCTGHSEAISSKNSDTAGISSFLQKPIALSELGRVVRQVLDQAKEVSPRG